MPPAIGLYYPYIHFRDEVWLKTAALYWPSMARIVPGGYPTHDSDTVRTLRAELDFVIDLRPDSATNDTARLFGGLLRDHGRELRRALRASDPDARWEGISAHDSGTRVAYIHVTKMAASLRHDLQEQGLLAGPRHPRHTHAPPAMRGDNWIAMDARLGAVYMCVLAERIAARNGLHPTTDQVEFQAAIGSWSADNIARAVLGDRSADVVRPQARKRDYAARIAFLALDAVVPKDLATVPAQRIVEIRKKHASELAAFQDAVDTAATELSGLPDDVDANVLDAYLRHQVERNFAVPTRDLERALRALRVPTARAVIGTRLELPAAVSATTLANAPLPVSLGVGAAVGLFNVRSDHLERRRELHSSHPLSAYLLGVESGLTPGGVLDRAGRTLRRMARPWRPQRPTP